MSGFTFGSYSSLGTADQTIAASSSTVFGTVDNAGKTATEVSLTLTYNAVGTKSASIQIERDADGTNFESESDSPWVVPMPAMTGGATMRKVITVDANIIGKFRVRVINNDTAYSITNVNIRTKQATYS